MQLSFIQKCFRFYTGKNVWSAFLNITKCRVKGGPDDGRARQNTGGRAAAAAAAAAAASAGPAEEESCPLRLSVAARRPPDVLDTKTRYIEVFIQGRCQVRFETLG
jgi:hypothetical protein